MYRWIEDRLSDGAPQTASRDAAGCKAIMVTEQGTKKKWPLTNQTATGKDTCRDGPNCGFSQLFEYRKVKQPRGRSLGSSRGRLATRKKAGKAKCMDHRHMSRPFIRRKYKRKRYSSRCAYYKASSRCRHRHIQKEVPKDMPQEGQGQPILVEAFCRSRDSSKEVPISMRLPPAPRSLQVKLDAPQVPEDMPQEG